MLLFREVLKKKLCEIIMLNAFFNNISVISLLSALLVEETGVPRENH
jgi:hypothetical protein